MRHPYVLNVGLSAAPPPFRLPAVLHRSAGGLVVALRRVAYTGVGLVAGYKVAAQQLVRAFLFFPLLSFLPSLLFLRLRVDGSTYPVTMVGLV